LAAPNAASRVTRVRRLTLWLGCALALTAVAAPESAGDVVPAPSYTPAEWHEQLAADQALGDEAAQELLGTLQLPPGAAPSPVEPVGGGTYLATRKREAGSGASDAQAWFTAPGTTTQVIEYIAAHQPPGAMPGFSPQTIEPNSFFDVRFPDAASEVSARQLGVFVSQLPTGGVGVLAHAQTAWTLPREQIPSSVRWLRVTVSDPRENRRSHVYRLLGPRRTAATKLKLESLLVDRPSFEVVSCPAGWGSVGLSFLTARHARPVAHATIYVGGCGGVTSAVEGHEQPWLFDGGNPSLLTMLERWLHFSIP
jgi:hypothetical protein